jgi:3-deoxy-D-manno-octulosonate 8-phosphate phosphatase (KDO 8-P phosphatase)
VNKRSLEEKARALRLVLLDVDGVLTDGRLYLAEGFEMKAYDAKDGLGITLLRSSGLKVGVLTGRRSASVEKRAKELHLDFLVQGRPDKGAAFDELLATHAFKEHEVAYMGDDWIDLNLMARVGFSACPADARPELLATADYVSTRPGGFGAVREWAEFILRAKGCFEERLLEYLSGRGQAASAQKGSGQ